LPIAIQHFFKIVLYRCLDLIRHNIGTHLKHNKYIVDIPIPFCHNLYLSATLKQCLTEFAAPYNLLHQRRGGIVYLICYTRPETAFNIPGFLKLSVHRLII
jgi:hypothetical protein